ncbi:GTP-binding protein Rhes precursor, putative [Entamoeba dispar SAW760]|uniref:GTP-binding protein Rhes, putative n=1 Tax=Entamoeba dispar (strain ATCC PRA-260 / SAW760) TaxID=370354 RepID=B0E5G1_ENTDS|nr:GTP-binding protein Rhes precursor, putative [Entamoeba dispar SAW760]EDR30253.1 GTP-binding protein Rhes precursor, putative [Entamoeba dispar SAW760]|eukprot:EDR30253.1 GTP-binding protein Rhes precursor, putative [Entamoeba dispar SAW760]
MMKPVCACFVGPSRCGKTSIIEKYLHNKEVGLYEETIEDIYNCTIQREGYSAEIKIIENGGNREFKILRDFQLTKAEFIIYVLSVTDRENFEKAHSDILECINIIHLNNKKELPKFIIVGNKIDQEINRKVSTKDLTKLQLSLNGICECTILETSAKTSFNLKTLFMMLTVPRRTNFLSHQNPTNPLLYSTLTPSIESNSHFIDMKEKKISKFFSFFNLFAKNEKRLK